MPMSNYTFEDYKKEIKLKYQEIVNGGDYLNNLKSPTTANLRNLCIKRFESNSSRDDQDAFKFFFDFPFSGDGRNQFGNQELNKLESVKRFFLGITENPTEATVELSAVLIDFHERPYNNFRRKRIEEDSFNNITVPQPLVTIIKEALDYIEVEKEISKPQEEFDDLREKEFDSGLNIKEQVNNDYDQTPSSLIKNSLLKKIREIIIKKFIVRLRRTVIATVLIFSLVGLGTFGTVIYFNFFKKGCMQWSGDHFDEVSCNLEIQTTGTFNSPIPYDERIINLKKIKVCDTTAFFKNEEAVVWYTKVGDGVEFFNTHGLHPENGKALRPVTQYIINKYVKKH